MSAAESTSPSTSPSKAPHLALWVVQVLVASAFFMAGSGKATKAVEDLATRMTWATAVPLPLLRFIGASEMLGALGLLLPSLTRILPWLTPLAAAGLTTIMALAIPFHAARGETGGIVFNFVLGGLAAFIAWGRWKKAPIASR